MTRRLFAIPIIAVAALLALLIGSTPAQARTFSANTSTTTGFDISYPQCSSRLPKSGSFGIVGVNDGIAWSANPCLASEYKWAAGRPQPPAFYMNTANPGPISSHWNLGGPKGCSNPSTANDLGCAYDYGWNAAAYAFSTAAGATSTAAASGHDWWADVETANSWNGSPQANAADIQGALDYLHSRGVVNAGIYSTSYQWGQIAGGAAIAGAPDWIAGGTSLSQATAMCQPAYSFSGGPVWLTQYPNGSFDGDARCQ